jgi:hypothetical protein
MFEPFIRKIISRMVKKIVSEAHANSWEDRTLILQAKSLMASDWWRKVPDFSNPKWIQEKEFRVYSQFNDDGIVQWLVLFLNLGQNNFVEFGVGDFFESNSHFLLVNNAWKGFIMDGSEYNISRIKNADIYWRFSLKAKQAFIDKHNINQLVAASCFDKIGYLHIDLDGNDYWILDALDLTTLAPDILVLEYNAVFGDEDPLSIPYDPNFQRMDAHYSGKYFGASLPALNHLAEKKGYYFIGCNSAGNNAYFLSKKYQAVIPKSNLKSGFEVARFRESRNTEGRLVFLDLLGERELIRGLPVINVMTGASDVL